MRFGFRIRRRETFIVPIAAKSHFRGVRDIYATARLRRARYRPIMVALPFALAADDDLD